MWSWESSLYRTVTKGSLVSQFGEADENVFELRSADDKISVLIEGQAIQAESMPAKTQKCGIADLAACEHYRGYGGSGLT